MTKQSEHYLTTGRELLERKDYVAAERAFRAAQNHLAAHESDYLAQVKEIQALIITSLEGQIASGSARSLGAKGRAVNSEAQQDAARANGAKGGRPREITYSIQWGPNLPGDCDTLRATTDEGARREARAYARDHNLGEYTITFVRRSDGCHGSIDI